MAPYPTASEQAERAAALACFDSGDYAQASTRLVSLLAHVRADPLLLRACGMALTRTGKIDQGVRYLAKARRLSPNDPLSTLWHGIGLQAAGRTLEAIEALSVACSLSPSDSAGFVHMSRALLAAGRPEEAIDAARRATALAPALAEATYALRIAELAVINTDPALQTIEARAGAAIAWARLGTACLALDRIIEARSAFLQALIFGSMNPDIEIAVADLDHVCGEPITAIERLRAVMAAHPDHSGTRLHLAEKLLLHDQTTEASALLDRDPMQPELDARWHGARVDALVRLGRITEAGRALSGLRSAARTTEISICRQDVLIARYTDPRGVPPQLVERLARLAMDPAAAPIEPRIDAHFLLGDILDSASRPDLAFRHWSYGHALLRNAQPFSREVHATMVDGIVETYDALRLSNGRLATIDDDAAVFIVGLPRTGTTLTEHILAAHRQVHGAGERMAVRQSLERLTTSPHLGSALREAAHLSDEQLAEAAGAYLSDLHGLSPMARIVIDKMPDNAFFLGFIATLLPNARVIWCTRDLRDVGASIFRQRFLGAHPYAHDLADLGWYLRQHERLMRHWTNVLPLRILAVDHSDWIEDFPATLARVLTFLDLPHDPACLDFHNQDRKVRTASREQVRQKVNKAGVGRWRRYEPHLQPMLSALADGSSVMG